MRRVDNIVSVLDSALQRSAQSAAAAATTSTRPSVTESLSAAAAAPKGATSATPEELATTAQGQRMLNSDANADLNARRHGRGPRQGEIASGSLPHGQVKMLGDQARTTGTIKLLERWKADMPTEAEMLPRDKYTIFDRKAKHYRKGVHSKPIMSRSLVCLEMLTLFSAQSCPNGRESLKESILPVSRSSQALALYYTCALALWLDAMGFENAQRNREKDGHFPWVWACIYTSTYLQTIVDVCQSLATSLFRETSSLHPICTFHDGNF